MHILVKYNVQNATSTSTSPRGHRYMCTQTICSNRGGNLRRKWTLINFAVYHKPFLQTAMFAIDLFDEWSCSTRLPNNLPLVT